MGDLPFTSRAAKVLELSLEEANQLGHNYIGTEHLLLGLIKERKGVAAQVLTDLSVNLEAVREEVLEFLGTSQEGGEVSGESEIGGKSKTPALDAFGRDLTLLARQGELDPVIGRDNERDRLVQIICRRDNHNILLIGEAGVGKTTIIERLAQDIIDGYVPRPLRGTRLIELDLTRIAAGTKHHEQQQERVNAVINEARRVKNVILLIDNIHRLVDTSGAPGALGLANALSPYVSQGEIQCIGTTTPAEYMQHLEKNSDLIRTFQSVMVTPPSPDLTLAILKAMRQRYEKYHNVQFTDKALVTAVNASNLFRPELNQPTNALLLIDDAGANVRTAAATPPVFMQELEAEIAKLDKEKEECVSEHDFERAAYLRDYADKLRKKRDQIESDWALDTTEVDGTVDEEVIVKTLAMLTGISADAIHHGNVSAAPRLLESGSQAHPEYERLQVGAILLQGTSVRVHRGSAFVLMPFGGEFESVYSEALAPALEANHLNFSRGDDISLQGAILPQVWEAIRTSEVIIADVSSSNPNVIFELGLCFGVGRLPLMLVRNQEELPFNLRSLRYIEYESSDRGREALCSKLTLSIREFLAMSRVQLGLPSR